MSYAEAMSFDLGVLLGAGIAVVLVLCIILIVAYILTAIPIVHFIKAQGGVSWLGWIPLLQFSALVSCTDVDNSGTIKILGSRFNRSLVRFFPILYLCALLPYIGALSVNLINIIIVGAIIRDAYAKTMQLPSENFGILGGFSGFCPLIFVAYAYQYNSNLKKGRLGNVVSSSNLPQEQSNKVSHQFNNPSTAYGTNRGGVVNGFTVQPSQANGFNPQPSQVNGFNPQPSQANGFNGNNQPPQFDNFNSQSSQAQGFNQPQSNGFSQPAQRNDFNQQSQPNGFNQSQSNGFSQSQPNEFSQPAQRNDFNQQSQSSGFNQPQSNSFGQSPQTNPQTPVFDNRQSPISKPNNENYNMFR